MNPFATILSHNKLNGANYVDWKRNLDIVLTAENLKKVLTKPFPEEPLDDASKEEVEAYAAWKRSDELARCYILASMENVLQQQHNNMESAADIMYNLADMFGEQGRQVRQDAMRKLMNLRMKAGTPIRTHMLEVIGLLNELEIMGAEVDGETQIDMALNTLDDSFNAFKLNYSMNKLSYSLPELMKELQSAEALISKSRDQKKGEVHFSKKASSSGSKGPKPKKNRKRKERPSTSKPSTSKKPKKDQSKDMCLYCKEMGHWKRNCPTYKKDLDAGTVKGVQGNKKA